MGTWALEPDVTYLNHGSFGACPEAVLDEQSRLRRQLESEPVRFMMRERELLADRAREVLARFVGADPDDVVPVTNATVGVNTVLRCLKLQPGDELLATDHGYNACTNALRAVAGAAGARVVIAPVPFPLQSSQQIVDAVMAHVTDRTRVALIDHVTSPTGLVFPLEALISRLRQRGVQTLVDGAHAPGMLPLHLGQLGADWYTGNLHKWVCAPKGAAFLWVRRELQSSVRPLVISHAANSPRTDKSRFQLEFDWTGTNDPTAWLCVPRALETVGALAPSGWPEVMRLNRELELRGRDLALAALGTNAPAPDELLGSLAAVVLPGGASTPGALPGATQLDPLQDALFFGHRIEVPVFTWGPSSLRLLRLSAQRYNSLPDYQKLARVLPGALRTSGANGH